MTLKRERGRRPRIPPAPPEYDQDDQDDLRAAIRSALFEIVQRSVRHGGLFALPNFTDANRPDASAVDPGTPIWNTDDDQANYSDGTTWRDPQGNPT